MGEPGRRSRGRSSPTRPSPRRWWSACPDADGLTRPAAFVVLAQDAGDDDELAAELRRHVARALEPHKAPQSVTVLEALPRLPSGKLDRRRLREG